MSALNLPAKASLLDAACELTRLNYRVAPGKFNGIAVEHDIRGKPIASHPLDFAARSPAQARSLIPESHTGPLLVIDEHDQHFGYDHQTRKLTPTATVVQVGGSRQDAIMTSIPITKSAAIAVSAAEFASRYRLREASELQANDEANLVSSRLSKAKATVLDQEARTNRLDRLKASRKKRLTAAYADGTTADLADLDSEIKTVSAEIAANADDFDVAEGALAALVAKHERTESVRKDREASCLRAKAEWARAHSAGVLADVTKVLEQLSIPLATLRALDAILEKGGLGSATKSDVLLQRLQAALVGGPVIDLKPAWASVRHSSDLPGVTEAAEDLEAQLAAYSEEIQL